MLKKCNKCNLDRSLDAFCKKKASPDGLNSKCRDCHKQYLKEHYQKHKAKRLESIKAYKQKTLDWYEGYKTALKCNRCGESHPATLDFHHNNEKDFSISKAVFNGYSIERILVEITKCTCLCSNCHRKLHHDMRTNNDSTDL